MKILSSVGLAPEERRNALLLIGSNFFEGLAIALFYSVALTYFLDHNPIKTYGWLMVASGGVVVLLTPLYQRVEHILKTSNLFLFLAAATLVIFAAGYAITGFKSGLSAANIGFGLMVLHHLIYVLYKVRFWGLSALFYDVRQSKRVFGLIGSVNLPAKFLGYTLVTTLDVLGDIGFANLMLIGVASYLGSTAFMYFIIKENPETLHLSHEENKRKGPHAKSIVKGIMGLSVVMVFTLSLVNFLFAKEVQHHFELTDGNMFQLISKALALSYGLATIVKIVISGRVLGRFKLKALLLVTPLLLAVAILTHWIIRSTYAIEEQEYLFFVMLMIGSLMLTEAIDNPLVMSLFQPLSKREILGGHTLVKGYAESVGIMLVGGSLIWFYGGHKHIDLVVAIPVVFGSAALWLIAGRRFAGKYLYHLRHLIELKLIKGDQALFLDQDTEHHLKKQLGADDIRVVEQSLEILLVNKRVKSRHIKRLLNSKRAEIRTLGLSTLEDSSLVDQDLVDYLTEQLSTAEVEEKCRILTVLAGSISDDEIQRYLRSNDEEEQYALALGLAKKTG